MISNQRVRKASVVPIRAHLAAIEVVGHPENMSSNMRPDHFVVVSVDNTEVAKSETKPRVPSTRWEWQEDHRFLVHPSSTIKIMIYRKGRVGITKDLVGQHTGTVVELLENDEHLALKDKSGSEIVTKMKMNLSLVSEPADDFESLMESIGADISRLAAIPAIGKALYFIKNIMDIVPDAHPILKMSSTVISSMYRAVQQAELLDDTVRDLAESLQEMLGVAKERPDLLLVKGTNNVVEEIGRTSLSAASLIHEYARRRSFIRRTLNSQLSDDMKSRITVCQKSCNDLKQKFDRRIGLDTNDKVGRMEGAIREVKDNQLAKEIYQWLSAPDSSKNYNEACKKRQKDTCAWFLNGEQFCGFQEKAGLLWIKGTTGCGKTILISSIIERISELCQDCDSAIAYFFFDGRDGQKDLQLHDKLIRSLILQLSVQSDTIPPALVELYGHGHQQPSTKSLQDTLCQIIQGFESTYLIIDSLHECTERVETSEWISAITSLEMGNLHIVVASRPERDIVKILQPLKSPCIDVAEEVNQDIALYLEQQIALVEKWDEETRKIVKSRLMERAEGMFRWIALQIMELKKCSNRQSVIKQLDSLPMGLYETYDQILLRIDNQTDRTDTNTFLRWLCFSTRPLTFAEIAETVIVDFAMEDGPRYTPSRRYWDEKDVLDKCSGFITESEGKVKLAHFSIKEYLISEDLRARDSIALSSFHLTEELSHSLISQTCLVFLLQLGAFSSLDWNMVESFPLTLYAAEHWVFHAQSGNIDKSESSVTLTLAQNLFLPANTAFINWVRVWDLDLNYPESDLARTLSSIAPSLYYAAQAGLLNVSQYLLEKDVDVNQQGGKYGNALQAASFRGHKAIVKLLLEKGADVNVQGRFYGNALQAASLEGHEVIVKLLLEKGADVNVDGGSYGNALQVASDGGHKAIVQLLLEKGADVNEEGGEYGNALQAASCVGHEAIVELLLEKGVDVNVQGGFYGNALQGASYGGHEAVVKLLLEKGADLTSQGGNFGNALQAASYGGREAIAKLLLEKGANVNARGGFYNDALQAASIDGSKTIVKLLLEKGADVDVQGGFYGNALQAASCGGHKAIVKLLLEKGADLAAQGGKYGNALQAASYTGREAIAKLLLEKGADVNVQGGFYGNALQTASAEGHEAIVKLLLEKGAYINGQGGEYGNALQAASAEGHEAVVKLLLEKGADVTAQGGEYGSALHAASEGGYHTIVKLLLENGADLTAHDGEYGSALQAASAEGHEAIVKLLLEKGADVNEQGGEYGNALQAASAEGHEAIVKLLLEKGADVTAQGGEYGSALQAAAEEGHEAIVKLLLEHGAVDHTSSS